MDDGDAARAQGDGPDEASVEELLARHLPGLRAYVRLRAGPLVRAREAESDVVQSACQALPGSTRSPWFGDAVSVHRRGSSASSTLLR